MATIKRNGNLIVLKSGKVSCACCCPIPQSYPYIDFTISGTDLSLPPDMYDGFGNLYAHYEGTLNGSWQAPRVINDDVTPIQYRCRARIEDQSEPYYPPEVLTGPIITLYLAYWPLPGDPPAVFISSVEVEIAQFPADPFNPLFPNLIWTRIRLRTYATTLPTVPNVFLYEAPGELQKDVEYENQLANGGKAILSWVEAP